MNKVCAWDIEIAAVIPNGRGVNWADYRPYGITCAAIWTGGENTHTFVPDREGERYDPKMSPEACAAMLDVLLGFQQRGYDVVTWNGAYFDFDVLAEECPAERFEDVVALAQAHVDPGLQMLRELGFMCGLAAAAQGCDLGGKLMKGGDAPVKWKQGAAEQEEVVRYVRKDALLTGQVYQHILQTGGLPYWSKRDYEIQEWFPQGWRTGNRLLTAEQVGELPAPRNPWKTYEEATAWMSQPRNA